MTVFAIIPRLVVFPKSFVAEIGLPVDRGEISIVLDDSTDPALSRVRETGAVEGH